MRYFSSLSLLHITMYSLYDTWLIRWVFPFGDLRIKVYSQLPGAYRSVLRPSSPSNAKASTKCSYYIYFAKNLRLHDACRVIFTHAISIHSRLNLYFISRCVFSFYSLFNFSNSFPLANVLRTWGILYIHSDPLSNTIFKNNLELQI